MKTLCPPNYLHIYFSATNSARYTMYSVMLLVPMNERVPRKLSNECNISGQ